jgi:hypothetical protein
MRTNFATALVLCLLAQSAYALGYRVIDINAAGGWQWAEAVDINEAGVVVGDWQDNAFAYNIHTNTFLGDLRGGGHFTTSGNSYASGINDRGQIVGFAGDMPDGTGREHHYLWDSHTDTYTVLAMGYQIDIGVPMPGYCENAYNNPWAYACLDITNDGTLTWASAYSGPSGAELLPFTDPTFGFTSFTPYALNSRGIVVGIAWHEGYGGPHALVFIPTSVPEPGTLALLGFGLAGLGLSRRRKAN